MRKKYSKLFSIFAIVLAAFLLFGSVSTLKTVSADTQKTYSKSVTVDTILSLATEENTPITSGNYYVEFGEYPQSRIDSTAETTIQDWINELKSNNGKNASANIVSRRAFSKTTGNLADSRISYDSTTGYYTLLKSVEGDTKTYPAGTKVHEYISGVDAATKYPVYKVDASGNEVVVANQSGSVNQSIRGGVVFSRQTTDSNSYVIGVDTSNGYSAGTSYLFEVEPIKWRIYKITSNDTIVLQSDIILDSMGYNLYSSNGTYYGSSYLRNWLNMTSGETNAYNPINMANTSSYSYSSGEEFINSSQFIGQFAFDDADMALKGSSTKSTQEYRSDGWKKEDRYYITYENSQCLIGKKLVYDNYSYFRSFYDMAFDSAEKSLIQDQTVEHNGFVSWSPSQRGETTVKVTIPDLSTTAEGFVVGSSGNGAYSEYALATGLVAGYDGYYIDNRPSNTAHPTYDISKAGTETTYGFVWAMHANRYSGTGSVDFTGASMFILDAGDDKEVTLQQPSDAEAMMPYYTGTSKNTAYYYKQHNTYGVLPQIEIDVTSLLGEDGFEIKSNGTTNGIVDTGNAVSDYDYKAGAASITYSDLTSSTIENNSELFVQRMSGTATTNSEIVVKSYTLSRPTTGNHKLKVTFSVGDQYDNGYIKLIYNNSEATPTSKTYGDCTYLTSGKVFTFALPNVAKDANGNRYVSMELDFGSEKIGSNFMVSAYAVSSNERLITYITGSDIKSYSLKTYKTNDDYVPTSTITLFEGESYTLAHKATMVGTSSEIQSWFYKGTGTQFTSQPSSTTSETDLQNAGYVIYASRETGLAFGDDSELFTNEIYTNFAGSLFGVKINKTNSNYVTNFMYVASSADDNATEIPFYKNGETLYEGIVGSDVQLTIKIKNPYISKAEDIVDSFKIYLVEGGATPREVTDSVDIEAKYVYFPGSTVQKEYIVTITIRGEFANAFTDSGSNYNYVLLETNILASDDLAKEDTYSITESTRDIDFAGVKENDTDVTTTKLKTTNATEQTTIKDIGYNSDITTQINLNTGYYVSIKQMPEMTFTYNAVVVDDNNYRMSETSKYPDDYVASKYQGSNIRVNKDGKALEFDANNNLIYNNATTILKNVNGVYYSTSGNYWYVPTFKLYSSSGVTGLNNFTEEVFTTTNTTFDDGVTFWGATNTYSTLTFNGANDTWTYIRNKGLETEENVTSFLTISRDVKNPNYCADNNKNHECFYLVVDYYTLYKGDATGIAGTPILMGYYISTSDASYTYKLDTSTLDNISKDYADALLSDPLLMPYSREAKSYNPWIERIKAKASTIEQTHDDQAYFTGSFNTGILSDAGFNYQRKMWYFINENGEAIQLSQTQGDGLTLIYDDAVAYIGEDGNRYIKYKEVIYKIFSVNGISGNITYFLKSGQYQNMGFIKPNDGNMYNQNEIIITLNIDNVVSDIEFDFTGAEAYEYQVNFTSDFSSQFSGGIAGYGSSFDVIKAFNPSNVDGKIFTYNTSTIEGDKSLADSINLETYEATDAGTRTFKAIEILGVDNKLYKYYLAPKTVVEVANGSAEDASTYIQYTNQSILQFIGWKLSDASLNSLTDDCQELYLEFVEKYKNEYGYLDLSTIIYGGSDETTHDRDTIKWQFQNTFASLEFVAVYQDMEFNVQLQAWEPNTMTDAIVATAGENPDSALYEKVSMEVEGEDGRPTTSTAYSLKGVYYGNPIYVGNNSSTAGYNAGMIAVKNYIGSGSHTFGDSISVSNYATFKDWYYVNNNTKNNDKLSTLTSLSDYDDVITKIENWKLTGTTDTYLFMEVFLWGDTTNRYFKYNANGTSDSAIGDAYIKVVKDGELAKITWYSRFNFATTDGDITSATKIYTDMVLTAVFETKMYTITGLDENYSDIFEAVNNPSQVLMDQDVTLDYYVTKKYSQTAPHLSDFSIYNITLGGTFTLTTEDGYTVDGTASITTTTREATFANTSFAYNTWMITITLKKVRFDIDIKMKDSVTYTANSYSITFPSMLAETNTSNDSYDYGQFDSSETVNVVHGGTYNFSFVRNVAYSQSVNLNNALQIKLGDGTVVAVKNATTIGWYYNSGDNKYYLTGIVDDIIIEFVQGAGEVENEGTDGTWVLNTYNVVTENGSNTANSDEYYYVNPTTDEVTGAMTSVKEQSVVHGDDAVTSFIIKDAYSQTVPILVFRNYVVFFPFNLTFTDNIATVNYLDSSIEITKNAETYTYTYSWGSYTYTISTTDNVNYDVTISGAQTSAAQPSLSIQTQTIDGSDALKYIITFKNVTYAPNAYLLGAFNVDSEMYTDSKYNSNLGWVRNIYEVTLPYETSASSNTVYTVKTYNKSTNDTTGYAVTSSNNIVRIYHGDSIDFQLTIGEAYTQMLPVLVIDGTQVSLEDCEKEIDETDNTITYTHSSGARVVLTYTLDTTFSGDNFADIVGNKDYIDEGLFPRYQYTAAAYDITLAVVDSKEVTIKYYYFNESDSAYAVYDDPRLNQYVVAYHKGILSGNTYTDNGSLYYNAEGTLDTQQKIWKTYYYEVYSYGSLITNPFSYTAEGTVGYAFQHYIEGHKYADEANWYTVGSTTAFDPSTTIIIKNTILLAPYEEETYNTTSEKLEKASERSGFTYKGADDGNSYDDFGVLKVNYSSTYWKTKASETDTWTEVSSNITFSGVAFSKTNLLKVQMKMYSAYDQGVPYFVVSKYGVILYPGTEGYDVQVDNESNPTYYYYKPFASFSTYSEKIKYTTNNIERQSIYIKVTTSGANTIYTYYSDCNFDSVDKDNQLFSITFTPFTGTRGATVLTDTYTLSFLRNVDAGEPIDATNQANPQSGTFKISVDTSKITKLNEYTVEYNDLNYERLTDDSYGESFTYNKLGTTYTTYSLVSGDGREIPSITYSHGTNFVHLAKYNQAITGYSFSGWYTSGASTATFASAEKSMTMYDSIQLFAKFAALKNSVELYTGQSDFYIDSQNNLLFGEFGSRISEITYVGESTGEKTIRFTLGEAFTQYENLKFRLYVNVSGEYKIVSGLDTETAQAYFKSEYGYDNKDGVGYYIITLKYVRSTVYISLDFDNIDSSLEDICTNSIDKYTVTVYTGLNYSSNYSDGEKFTESYTFEVDTEMEARVFTNIVYNSTVNNMADYSNATLTNPQLPGWKFIGWYVAGIEASDSYNTAVSWYNEEYVDGDRFSLSTYPITSNLYVYPYFERLTYTVKVVDTCLENNLERDLGILYEYDNVEYTFQVKFGQSLYTDEDNRITINELLSIIANMQNYTDYRISHYTYNGVRYLPEEISFVNAKANDFLETSSLFNFIANRNMEIYVDFSREVYNITLVQSVGSGINLLGNANYEDVRESTGVWVENGIVKVPYGASIPQEIADLALSNFNVETGSHFEDWKNVANNSELLSQTIVSQDGSFFAYVPYNVYNFKVVSTNGSTISYINDIAASPNVNGEIPVNFSQRYYINFAPSEGYDMYAPTVEIWIGGVMYTAEDIVVDTNKKFTNTWDEANSRWRINFNNYAIGGDVVTHGTTIEIRVIGNINTYIMKTFNGHDLSFGVNENGDRVATLTQNDVYNPTVWTYEYNNIKIVEFSSKPANYGGACTLVIKLHQRYSEKSTFVFTLSAQEGVSGTYTLSPQSSPIYSEDGYNVYEFSLGNVKNSVTFTLAESTDLRINEYMITFKVYYGGGVNGWTEVSAMQDDLGNAYYDLPYITVESEALAVSPHAFDSVSKFDDYTLASLNAQYGWIEARKTIDLSSMVASDINATNFMDFNEKPGYFNHDITLYAFFFVESKSVTLPSVEAGKGNFSATDKADVRNDNNYNIMSGYKFSYEITDSYNQNIPVITMSGNGNYDFVLVSEAILGSMNASETKEASTSVVTYVVTRTANGYTYALSSALGATEGYVVSIGSGNYTFTLNGQEIAVAQNTINKFDVEVLSVSENFTLAVNDSQFSINKYTVTFKHVGGETEVETVTHGSSVMDVPTDTVNFIQKLVYVVTFADGTTAEYSANEIGDVTFTGNATVEIKAVINLVILIPIIVGAVLIIAIIVILIVKGSKGKADKTRASKSNEAMFDKLNQAKGNNSQGQPQGQQEAPKAESKKRTYNPYLDNKKDDNNKQ